MNQRIEKLRSAMERASIDSVLLSDLTNLRYFTGFYGGTAEDENMALVDKTHCVFLTDFRYTEQAQAQCTGFEVVENNPTDRPGLLDRLCREWGVKRLWLEEEAISLRQYRKLSGAMPDILLAPNEGAVKSIRVIKEPGEIEAIRRAQEIAEKGLEHLLGYIKPGMTEREAALELEFYTRREGSEGMAFPSIIAAGPHGAMPHAQLSGRKIRDGDMIVMDFGCMWQGYHSDMTRTVVMGKADGEMKEVYNLVLRAQQAALAGLKQADAVIMPEVAHIRPDGFYRARECILLGKRTALHALPGIKKLLEG